MKILLIGNSLKSIYRFRYWMVKKLVSDGHEVVIACPFDVDLYPNQEKISYINIHLDGKSTSLVSNLLLIARFARIAFKVKPELSLFYSNKPALFAPIAFKLIKTVTVSINTGFGSGFLMLKGNLIILNKVFNFFYSFADYIVVLNKTDYVYMTDLVKLNSDKVKILPGEGVDLEEFKYNNPERNCNVIKFVFVGRLITDKGVKELIKASQLLYKKFPGKFKLTVVGSRDAGHPKSINDHDMSLIRNSDYIEYIPYTDNISKILVRSDVFVLPSYREGLSRSAMEACSVGRPLIVSSVPGIVELVNNGVNGFLCNPKEHVSLYQAMSNFFDIDAKTIVDMGRESYSMVSNRYNIDAVYKIFNCDIIQKVKIKQNK